MNDGLSPLRRGRIVRGRIVGGPRGDGPSDPYAALTPHGTISETDPHSETDPRGLPSRSTWTSAASTQDATQDAIGATLRARRAEAHAMASRLPDVAALARILAERLVGAALAQSDEALLHFAAQLLDEARGARRLELSCAPPDAARLARALSEQGLEQDVTVTADAALPPNTLLLDTELGRLEATVSGALDTLMNAARRP